MRLEQLRRLPQKPRWPRGLPPHGVAGVILVAVAWPVSWARLSPLSEYSFFPLWLGYILLVDALSLRRQGTSLLASRPATFVGMFAASVPLWWTFEGINHFTQNWHYQGGEVYSHLWFVVASWHFSIVVPAVFVTAHLVGTLGVVQRLRHGPRLPVSGAVLASSVALGLAALAALLWWPDYAFSAAWLFLFLLLDPINYRWGRPSLLEQVGRGDWRMVAAFAVGALVCGWFWEMWNYWAWPKWHYAVPYFDFIRIFEMPLLGYGGYLFFGLEVYAAYHFLAGVVARVRGALGRGMQ